MAMHHTMIDELKNKKHGFDPTNPEDKEVFFCYVKNSLLWDWRLMFQIRTTQV